MALLGRLLDIHARRKTPPHHDRSFRRLARPRRLPAHLPPPPGGQFIAVVWFGPALTGWPGIVHGGVIATVMDESMGRCAIAKFPVQTGMTAKLEFNYMTPAATNAFHVVRAGRWRRGRRRRKGFVKGRLERLMGRVVWRRMDCLLCLRRCRRWH